MVDGYADFLATKRPRDPDTGLRVAGELHHALFPFQRDITRWALRRGRAAIFADCGLGKTLMQLTWASHIPGRVLILTPLAVAEQTVAEAARFGLPAVRAQEDTGAQVIVSNYEQLHHFDPSAFQGVVLDESSILKSYDGTYRTRLIEAFRQTPYRLACTATPAPNDYMELGNHAEFLGVMSRTEMLAMFFVHDGGETQQWRLKGHAETPFWSWMSSWAVVLRYPSDLGYSDEGFTLPPLTFHEHRVEAPATDGELFAVQAATLQERIGARRSSIAERATRCADLVNRSPGPWVIWCNLNAEAEAVCALIPDAVEIRGSDAPRDKVERMAGFSAGRIRVLVTKPSIAGFGMNWQHCAQVAFLGLSDSYEQFYQATRRCWRFGQTQPVHAHIITAETEGAVVANIRRKEADAQALATNMVAHLHELNAAELKGTTRQQATYETATASGKDWTYHLGDCVDGVRHLERESVDYTIFSPPFASLYTYSNSDRDMGNVQDYAEFAEHFGYLVPELYRVTKPGRLLSFHCMNLPTSKVRDGVIGLTDFRGHLIRLFSEAGWIYHSEVCIWKDPVTAMQRTKALGLLYKQLRKDSAMSRQGIPDYLVTMRKPGDNAHPVGHKPEDFPVTTWQEWASPVWMNINPSDTLQRQSAREDADERHIAPLQLEVIRRGVVLWSNPGDLVLSPFAGIASEGYVALQEGRRFVGYELKRSYWEQGCRNLSEAHAQRHGDLFAESEA